jgi:hypothetical protein
MFDADADPDPGSGNLFGPGSEILDEKIRIREPGKHSGSATLVGGLFMYLLAWRRSPSSGEMIRYGTDFLARGFCLCTCPPGGALQAMVG